MHGLAAPHLARPRMHRLLYLTAVLLVQGVEAQLHGALLDPPPGHTTGDVIQVVEALCLKAPTP